MSEHRIPRDPPPTDQVEAFFLTEPSTGQQIAMREVPDEMLDRHLAINIQGRDQLMSQVLPLLNQVVNASNGVAILLYEQDRRRRTIAVVGNLSLISGLRRQ
jgi:hypothetical protein